MGQSSRRRADVGRSVDQPIASPISASPHGRRVSVRPSFGTLRDLRESRSANRKLSANRRTPREHLCATAWSIPVVRRRDQHCPQRFRRCLDPQHEAVLPRGMYSWPAGQDTRSSHSPTVCHLCSKLCEAICGASRLAGSGPRERADSTCRVAAAESASRCQSRLCLSMETRWVRIPRAPVSAEIAEIDGLHSGPILA